MPGGGDRAPGDLRRDSAGPERRCGTAVTTLLATGLVLAAWSCADPADDLVISTAISLREPLAELAEEFRAARGGPRIVLNSGASGLLMQQILRDAPADAFISASSVEIDRLARDGRLLPGPPLDLARNALVIVVPRGATPPASLPALTDPRFRRIAMGNPRTSPVGRYAEAALLMADLWDVLRPRLVFGENARQVLEYVVRAEVEAGLLYRTDARLGAERVGPLVELPPVVSEGIVYRGAILRASRRPRLAREFLEYVAGSRGQARLAAHGFLPPGR